MVPTGKNNALEIQMTERGGRAAIYQIKAVVQSNTRPCRQWKRQFIFNIERGGGEIFRDVVAKRIWLLLPPPLPRLAYLQIYEFAIGKDLMDRKSYGYG